MCFYLFYTFVWLPDKQLTIAVYGKDVEYTLGEVGVTRGFQQQILQTKYTPIFGFFCVEIPVNKGFFHNKDLVYTWTNTVIQYRCN